MDERKSIIDGTHDEYLATAELYDKIWEKETHNMTLKAGTKTDGVTYLQEQALQAPNSVKNQLKGDAELTTDLIARNNPLDIKAELKDLKQKKTKLESNEKKAEANEIQKHIDLLEQGLEKTKAPKDEPIVEEKTEPVTEQPIPVEQQVKEAEEVRDAEIKKIEDKPLILDHNIKTKDIAKLDVAKLKEFGRLDTRNKKLKELIDCLWK